MDTKDIIALVIIGGLVAGTIVVLVNTLSKKQTIVTIRRDEQGNIVEIIERVVYG